MANFSKSRDSRNISISLPSTGLEEWESLREPLESGWLTQGPKVAEFEKSFAEKHQVSHALATTSCTTALHLMLVSAGIGPGDEVLVPSFTWVSTANAVLYCGATPILCDVDPATFNISITDMANRVTSKTRAVIVVHLFGLCVDVPAVRSALPEQVRIFEDCACAAGATFKGISAGALGDAGAFSFHPRKSITTGEGGMLTTNNSDLALIVDQLRNHGASVSEEVRHLGSQPYLLPDFNLLGFNYRMTDLQGAIGIVQLAKLSFFVAERNKWANFYQEELSDLSWLSLPSAPPDTQHAWQSFVTLIDENSAPFPRNEIMRRLSEKGVATRPGTHAIHMLGYYSDRYSYAPNDFPGALLAANQSMSIPLHNRMDEGDYQYVVDTLHDLGR